MTVEITGIGGVVRHHKWMPPPPGAGRVEVCRHCGARKTVAGESCPGTHRDAQVDRGSDYDPFE